MKINIKYSLKEADVKTLASNYCTMFCPIYNTLHTGSDKVLKFVTNYA